LNIIVNGIILALVDNRHTDRNEWMKEGE